jgi:hypothetical protein
MSNTKRSHEIMMAEDAALQKQPSTEDMTLDDVMIKNDLLPNVLGFVLDVQNYFVLSSVCCAWKRGIDQDMEPPFLDTTARLSLQYDEHGTPITREVSLPLFKQALVTLKNRDSKMYRHPKDLLAPSATRRLPLTEAEGVVSFERWPSLLPRSHVTLSYFFWILCLQSPPHDQLSRLYQVTEDYLQRLFGANIQKCAKVLLREREGSQIDPLMQLAKIVSIWRQLRGISKTVVGMTNYLDKSYVPEQKLSTMQEIADRALLVSLEKSFSDSTSWDKTTAEATSRLDVVMEQVLKEISTEEGGRAFLQHLPLLERACEACEALRAMLERNQQASSTTTTTDGGDENDESSSFSVTTSENIIQICTRVPTAIGPVIEAMKKVVVVVEKRGMGAALKAS